MRDTAVVSGNGARRWAAGHPWIFRSDVRERPDGEARAVRVTDVRGAFIGWALWSPSSEISLRRLDARESAVIDGAWWRERLQYAADRRKPLAAITNAWRLVHAEGDGLPSLVVDQYDKWLVVQLLSAGVEYFRKEIIEALCDIVRPAGILARNDAGVREREGLARGVEPVFSHVPRTIEVFEGDVRYLAAPHDGQKTGAFIDQRDNRLLAGSVARGRALDCFAYHGSFALHLAKRADSVVAVDSSGPALTRAADNAERNALANIEWREADVFEFLREQEQAGERYETIVLDPPAFAKNKPSVQAALRGYHDINVRALKLLAPGGALYTASCSYHVHKPLFLEMLQGAAADSGRRVSLRAITGQGLDHPELLTVPETGYLKGALLVAD